ncbi:MAG: hypothetical protein GYA55_02590, partial [SAR324 cluster bacterium]|nr:hypothetical protein [SAR324 cluster bacterium]
IREEDFHGAIKNPQNNREEEKEKIETPSSELIKEKGLIDPMKLKIEDWEKRDPQFTKAFEILKSMNGLPSEKPPFQAPVS